MLGLLVARAGVNVTVMEKQADLLRDTSAGKRCKRAVRLVGRAGALRRFAGYRVAVGPARERARLRQTPRVIPDTPARSPRRKMDEGQVDGR